MKRWICWLCAAPAAVLAAAIVYLYGFSPATFVVALILLACPFLVLGLVSHLGRVSEREIDKAVHRESGDKTGRP